MNLLREYIRRVLTESAIDPKIMRMIDQADKANYHVEIVPGAARIYDGSKNKIASVAWYPPGIGPSFGPCAKSAIVNYSGADEGLGPLAYDVAIEVTGGLASDRTEVSGEAEAVWNRYMSSRPDVVVDQLDIMDDYELPQLTPNDESDDCEQVPAYDTLKDKWHTSPLSKKYSKAGTPVMDELRKRGMLYEK
tara:strand:+ start:426 stop:1001 length:576 start_codon:yes stop_codon:yes gene_type:complete